MPASQQCGGNWSQFPSSVNMNIFLIIGKMQLILEKDNQSELQSDNMKDDIGWILDSRL